MPTGSADSAPAEAQLSNDAGLKIAAKCVKQPSSVIILTHGSKTPQSRHH